jgi:hypothetical protein
VKLNGFQLTIMMRAVWLGVISGREHTIFQNLGVHWVVGRWWAGFHDEYKMVTTMALDGIRLKDHRVVKHPY